MRACRSSTPTPQIWPEPNYSAYVAVCAALILWRTSSASSHLHPSDEYAQNVSRRYVLVTSSHSCSKRIAASAFPCEHKVGAHSPHAITYGWSAVDALAAPVSYTHLRAHETPEHLV